MKNYDKINDIILQSITATKRLPWQNPFTSSDLCNGISGRPYNFANSILLKMQQPETKSTCWYTFKQVSDNGGSIKKGAHGAQVTFFTTFLPEEYKTLPEEEQLGKRRICLRYYTVFNGDQIDGIASKYEGAKRTAPIDPIAEAEKIIADFAGAPEIRYHQSCKCACYCTSCDYVQIPDEVYYTPETSDEYYSAIFHELGHSTGHHSRLNRDMHGRHGDESYAREELVAELTSVYLCERAGILHKTLDNSEAYLQSWYTRLKKDPKLFVVACAQAEKAAKWILNDRAGIYVKPQKPTPAAPAFEQLQLFA